MNPNENSTERGPLKAKILEAGLSDTLEQWQKRVDAYLKNNPLLFGEPATSLSRACFYALASGGKRFRPAIVYMIGQALGCKHSLDEAALSVEMFHTASLIADDLPCMDDDDLRRGRPAVHKAFGESTALLASYALIAEGYAMVARAATYLADPDSLKLVLENFSRNTGALGATGGQFLDLYPPNLHLETVLEIMNKKTVTLFEVSFVLGWVFGGGDIHLLEHVKKAAYHFGMAFQIADDIQDIKQDKDREGAVNLALLLGLEKAKIRFFEDAEAFQAELKMLSLEKSELTNIIELLKEIGA